MNLLALPAFNDNYIWMLHHRGEAAVVDPGDATPVKAALASMGLQLKSILVTHHHADHVGGVDALRDVLDGPVYGPARERMPQPCVALQGGAQIEVLGLQFKVMDVPGHTAGHIAYAQQGDERAPLLFCGDTLFSAGCGRLFEGTPQQMHASLSALAALAGATQVCCTHEYTLSNLRFAAAVEPDNAAVRQHTAWCEAERAAARPTLPSTIERERQINPFLRCEQPTVTASALAHGAASPRAPDVFAALREWKNHFK